MLHASPWLCTLLLLLSRLVWLGRYWNWPSPPSSSTKGLSSACWEPIREKAKTFQHQIHPCDLPAVVALLKGHLEPSPIPRIEGSASHAPSNHYRPSTLDVPSRSSHFISFKRKTSLEAHGGKVFLDKERVSSHHN